MLLGGGDQSVHPCGHRRILGSIIRTDCCYQAAIGILERSPLSRLNRTHRSDR
jgi:hypothetical protein